LSDDERWRRTEPPGRGPSTPNNLRFDPLASGIGVFFAIAIPIAVVGYTRPGGTDGAIIAIGVLVGLIAGVAAGLWLAERDGDVWRGPRL
jgi:hypothetical protein